MLVHLAKRFQSRNILKIGQSETTIACGGHVLTDRDDMSNLYIAPPKDGSYQVSVHLAMRLQRRRYLKISQSETRIAK